MAPIQAKKTVVPSPLSKRASNNPKSTSKPGHKLTAPVAPRTSKNNTGKAGVVVRGLKQLMLVNILGSQALSIPTTTTDRSKDRRPPNVLRKPAPSNKPPFAGQSRQKRLVPTRPALQSRPPFRVSPRVDAPVSAPSKKPSPPRPSRIPVPILVTKPPFKVPFAITPPVGQPAKAGGAFGSCKQRTSPLARRNSHFFTPPTVQPTRVASAQAKTTTPLLPPPNNAKHSRIPARPSAPTPLAAGAFRLPPSKLFLPRPCPFKRSDIDSNIFGASDRLTSAMEDVCLDMMSPSPSPPSLQLHQVFGEIVIGAGKGSEDAEKTIVTLAVDDLVAPPVKAPEGDHDKKDGPASDFAHLRSSVSVKDVVKQDSETPLNKGDERIGGKVQEGADSDVESKTKGLTADVRMNTNSKEMPGIVDELKVKSRCRSTGARTDKIPIPRGTSPAKTISKRTSVNVGVHTMKVSTKMSDSRRGAYASSAGKDAAVHKKIIIAKPMHGSDLGSDMSSTATTLSGAQSPLDHHPILSPGKPLSDNPEMSPTEIVRVNAFGTRPVRRVFVLPHVDDRLPSRDVRIQLELESLRARKRVGGGLHELSQEGAGVSLAAQGIISKVRMSKEKTTL